VPDDGGDYREVMWDAARSMAHDPANRSSTIALHCIHAMLHNKKDAMEHNGILVMHMQVLGE
jgi:hypothetical protein